MLAVQAQRFLLTVFYTGALHFASRVDAVKSITV